MRAAGEARVSPAQTRAGLERRQLRKSAPPVNWGPGLGKLKRSFSGPVANFLPEGIAASARARAIKISVNKSRCSYGNDAAGVGCDYGASDGCWMYIGCCRRTRGIFWKLQRCDGTPAVGEAKAPLPAWQPWPYLITTLQWVSRRSRGSCR